MGFIVSGRRDLVGHLHCSKHPSVCQLCACDRSCCLAKHREPLSQQDATDAIRPHPRITSGSRLFNLSPARTTHQKQVRQAFTSSWPSLKSKRVANAGRVSIWQRLRPDSDSQSGQVMFTLSVQSLRCLLAPGVEAGNKIQIAGWRFSTSNLWDDTRVLQPVNRRRVGCRACFRGFRISSASRRSRIENSVISLEPQMPICLPPDLGAGPVSNESGTAAIGKRDVHKTHQSIHRSNTRVSITRKTKVLRDSP